MKIQLDILIQQFLTDGLKINDMIVVLRNPNLLEDFIRDYVRDKTILMYVNGVYIVYSEIELDENNNEITKPSMLLPGMPPAIAIEIDAYIDEDGIPQLGIKSYEKNNANINHAKYLWMNDVYSLCVLSNDKILNDN